MSLKKDLSHLDLPEELLNSLRRRDVLDTDALSRMRFGDLLEATGCSPEALIELAFAIGTGGFSVETTSTHISELDLSTRPKNAVRRAGITTIEELQRKSRFQLSSIPNLGNRSIDEIEEKLRTYTAERDQHPTGLRKPNPQTFERGQKREAPFAQIERIEDLVDRLGADFMERECSILIRRETETLDSIGKDLGITRERVRQLETAAKESLLEVAERHASDLLDLIRRAVDQRVISTEILLRLIPQDTFEPVEIDLLVALLRSVDAKHPRVFSQEYTEWWTEDKWIVENFLNEQIEDVVPCSTDVFKEMMTNAPFSEDFPVIDAATVEGSQAILHPVTGDLVRRTARHRDAAYLILFREDEPLRVDELSRRLKMKKHAIAESIRRDDRFIKERPNGLCHLKEWDLSGVQHDFNTTYDAVMHVLEAEGPLTAKNLYRKVVQIYPVSPASVQNVLAHQEIGITPQGEIDLVKNGAEHRPDNEPPQPANVKIDEDGHEMTVEVRVDPELLRGSGVTTGRYVTWWLGLRSAPTKQVFSCEGSEITVTRGIHGSMISTLRSQALKLGAEVDDILVLTFTPEQFRATISLRKKPSDKTSGLPA